MHLTNRKQAREAYERHLELTYRPEQAHDWSLRLARLEGQMYVFNKIEDLEALMTERGDDRDRIDFVVMTTLVSILESGADDTWSGRENDRRRTYFDGVCEAARTIRTRIESENFSRRLEADTGGVG